MTDNPNPLPCPACHSRMYFRMLTDEGQVYHSEESSCGLKYLALWLSVPQWNALVLRIKANAVKSFLADAQSLYNNGRNVFESFEGATYNELVRIESAADAAEAEAGIHYCSDCQWSKEQAAYLAGRLVGARELVRKIIPKSFAKMKTAIDRETISAIVYEALAEMERGE